MRAHGILCLAALLLACSTVTGSEVEIGPIQVDSVDVLILESFPVQVRAHVQGTIGDGCSEIDSVKQQREGNAITIEVLRRRPKDAICTQIAKIYDETLSLEGEFPAGTYTLKVNDFEKTFTVD